MSVTEKVLIAKADLDAVYEAGQKAEYDRFWDSFQQNGERRNYAQGFAGVCWRDDTYNPKYPIIVTSIATNMYQNSTKITSTKVPITIDTASAQYVFMGATGLKEIPEIKVTEKVVFSSWFSGCTALETIHFTTDSVIANNISFADSTKLTRESLMSIINALKNFATKKTLRYADGSYGSYDISGCDTDPKGFEWNVTKATLSGTTLTCECYYDEWTEATFSVYGIDITEEDVANIKTICADVTSYNVETGEFVIDVVITTEEVTVSKTLTIGTTNLAKLTDAEKKIATDKGWKLA